MKFNLFFFASTICWLIALNPSSAQNSQDFDSFYSTELADSYELLEKQNKKGLAIKNGEIIIPVEFDEVVLDNPYIFLKKMNKIGLTALDGHDLFPVEFDEIIFESGYVITRKMKTFGLYQLDGTPILKTEYAIEKIQKYIKKNPSSTD